jgi:hypothetical protein
MLAHLREGSPHGAFVPQNIHWGLFSRLEPAEERLRKRLPKAQARAPYVARAHADLDAWLTGSRAPKPPAPLDARAL